MVWIAGDKFIRRTKQALPLVVCEAPCLFWQRALETLDQAGIAWRIALISPSLAGLWAAARAGLGLTVRGDVGLPLSLVASATLFDLPKLGSIPVTLHRTSARKPAAVERLVEIVREIATRTFAG